MDFSLLQVDEFLAYIIGRELGLAKSLPLSECLNVAMIADGTPVWILTDCLAAWEEDG